MLANSCVTNHTQNYSSHHKSYLMTTVSNSSRISFLFVVFGMPLCEKIP